MEYIKHRTVSKNSKNRIYKVLRRSAFITLKNRKTNFQNVPKCRLLNPTKSEIGIISKKILEKVIKTVR